jgi:DNA primase
MAGRIPKQFIDELLTRTDIVDVIDARVPLKKAGKDYKACCPFHEEKTPSFTVSTDKQFYHCFGCGAHGSAIGFLMDYDHMGFVEAVEELAARAGLPVPKEAGAASGQEINGSADFLELLREAARFYRNQLREHTQAARAVDYLKGRGITGEIAHEFGLGYAPDGWDNLLRALGKNDSSREKLVHAGLAVKKEGGGYYDRFRDRIIFPIEDYRGRVVAFGGRILAQGEPKYLNSPETPLFHKGRELYGLFHARAAIKRENRVVVVEGYMDVVALAQFGIDHVVATLGTATTREHLERLFRHAPEVIFCFDGDRAGRDAAWRALENTLPAMREGRQVSFLFLPESEDPDSYVRKQGRDAFLSRLNKATPLPEYFFDMLSRQVDLGRLDGRARLVELARPLLSKMPSGVLRQMMLDRLAMVSRMDAEKLSALAMNPETSESAAIVPAFKSGKPMEPPSILRRAIALVLQNPRLAAKVTDFSVWATLEMPGMPLFIEMLELLKRSPDSNTALIIENFRDSDYQHHLAKLAVWDYPSLVNDVEAEFEEIIRRLEVVLTRQKTDALLQKQHAGSLTKTETDELARLLSLRRGTPRLSPSGH